MKMEKKPEVYWTLLSHEGWSLYVAATSEGLCFVGSQDHPWDEMSAWVSQRFPGSKLTQDDVRLQPYVTELMAYLDGEKDRFSIPLDVRGTPFNERSGRPSVRFRLDRRGRTRTSPRRFKSLLRCGR